MRKKQEHNISLQQQQQTHIHRSLSFQIQMARRPLESCVHGRSVVFVARRWGKLAAGDGEPSALEPVWAHDDVVSFVNDLTPALSITARQARRVRDELEVLDGRAYRWRQVRGSSSSSSSSSGSGSGSGSSSSSSEASSNAWRFDGINSRLTSFTRICRRRSDSSQGGQTHLAPRRRQLALPTRLRLRHWK